MNRNIGRYRVVRPLGRGAMGEVFEVEHSELGGRFAVKKFSLLKGSVEKFRRRFAVEGKLLAQINHPNVVKVHDMHLDENSGEAYIVLDLVLDAEGNPKTLMDLSSEVVDEDAIAAWFSQLCSALDRVHAMGIVHRDVKLNNVLIDGEGRALLSDFGIAKVLDEELRTAVAASATMTMTIEGSTRRILGTAAYLPPELENGGEVTIAADVYSLGVAFFRMLVGVWYDPYLTVDFKQLLAGFEYNWTEILPPLLAADPANRPTLLKPLADALRRPVRRAKKRVPVAALALSIAGAVAAGAVVMSFVTTTEEDPRAGVPPAPERVVTNVVKVVTERVVTNEVPVISERVITNEVPVVSELVVTNEVPVIMERVVTNEVVVVEKQVVTNEIRVAAKRQPMPQLNRIVQPKTEFVLPDELPLEGDERSMLSVPAISKEVR